MQANEDELQKALNDITNPAPATDDPGAIASPEVAPEAPVAITPPADAAPATDPSLDANAMLGDAPAEPADPAVPASDAPAPEPAMPGPINVDAPAPGTPETPAPETPAPEASTPETPAPDFTPPALATPEPAIEDTPATNFGNENLSNVKSNILRDLVPLMDKIQVAPEKKFEVYTDIIEENHDASVIGPAYDTARQIEDETRRGEALLDLFEKIEEFQK